MSQEHPPIPEPVRLPAADEIAAAADGPASDPDDMPLTGRQRLWLVGLVILKRARFILILLAVGMFIGYWDTVKNYWDKWARPHSVSSRELDPDHEFYCSMHPKVLRSDYEPNGDVPKCPICGMLLSLRTKGENVKLPEGIASRVQLTPERVAQAGIKTAPVEYRPMSKQTTTVGNVVFDESRLSRVVSRVAGYVEKLYVDRTFTLVHQGDPLADIYSPELYSTAQEMVISAKGTAAKDLVESGRKRLRLFGVSDQEIDAILSAGVASPRLVIRSPQTGFVIRKNVVAGAKVEDGMTLLEVADLSAVWIEADVYEKDIAFLHEGQAVEATVESLPGRTFTGKVALVYPQLDSATRTNRVRFQVANADAGLRPGMYATVQINTPLGQTEPFKGLIAAWKQLSPPAATPAVAPQGSAVEQPSLQPSPRAGAESPFRMVALEKGGPPVEEILAIPERAVVDTGDKKVVFVEREPGLFEGVEVQLGPRSGQYYPVIKGLKAGDQIAAAGGFLIDAETRLNPGAAATYFGASGGPQPSGRSGAPATAGQRKGSPVPAGPGKPAPAEPRPGPRVASVELSAEDLKNIEQLPDGDRRLARAQRLCPVTGLALGSMGVPVKIALRGQTVFLCCQGCVGKAKRNPDETLKKAEKFRKGA
jgi:membrane fusion protein, copper/silver efflux system